MKKFLSTILLSVICLLSLAQEYQVSDTLYAMRQDIKAPVRVIKYFKFQDSYEVEDIIDGTRYFINGKLLKFEGDKSVVIQTVQNDVEYKYSIKNAGEYLKSSSSEMLLCITASAVGVLAMGLTMKSPAGSAERITGITLSGVLGFTGIVLGFSSIINIGNAGKCLIGSNY